MARNPVFEALNRLLHPRPMKPSISARNREFLDQFRDIVAHQQSNPDFTTEDAAASLGMSRMHLNRKLRVLTGQSTHDYILGKRLEDACALLSQPLPIAFIATSVGFKSSSHFAKAFREKFGVTPSEYRAKAPLAREPTDGKRRPKR